MDPLGPSTQEAQAAANATGQGPGILGHACGVLPFPEGLPASSEVAFPRGGGARGVQPIHSLPGSEVIFPWAHPVRGGAPAPGGGPCTQQAHWPPLRHSGEPWGTLDGPCA